MAIRGIICGTGRAGTYLHYGALKAAGAEIVAFVDINEEMAKNSSKQYGVKNYYTSVEEALTKESNIDFVDICTYSATHLPIAKVALEHGCNVLIEKPITETIEEVEELARLREKHNRVVCAVHNHRFYPGVTKAREMVKSGELGDIVSIHREMNFNHDNVRMMEETHWSHGLPGGRLFEANPHNMYLIYSMIGEFDVVDIQPRKVYKNRWPHAAIDEFSAMLKSEKTSISLKMSMHCEKSTYGNHAPNFFVVVGTKKTIIFDYQNIHELNELNGISNRLSNKVSNRFFSKESHPVVKDQNGDKVNIGIGSGHRWILDRFIGYLEGRYESEPVPFDEALFVQKMNSKMGLMVEEKIEKAAKL